MIPWHAGDWLNPPPMATVVGNELVVSAARGSDFWQYTAYEFRRDSGHALLAPFAEGSAIEVSFVVDYGELYDQAGLLVRLNELTWIKAGVEVFDGSPQLSAVVTHGASDWSVAPVPSWAGAEVTLRASWSSAAVTLRARAEGGSWRLFRLVPFPGDSAIKAGPYCCAPEREGLTVRFTRWSAGDADVSLHARD